jgi:hypothetical protein
MEEQLQQLTLEVQLNTLVLVVVAAETQLVLVAVILAQV